MTFGEYVDKAEANFRMNNQRGGTLRRGQAYWNTLEATMPGPRLETIRGTAVDPFYNDDNLGEFLVYLASSDWR